MNADELAELLRTHPPVERRPTGIRSAWKWDVLYVQRPDGGMEYWQRTTRRDDPVDLRRVMLSAPFPA